MKGMVRYRNHAAVVIVFAAVCVLSFFFVPATRATLEKAQVLDAMVPGQLAALAPEPLAPLEYPKEPRVLYVTSAIAGSGKMDGVIGLIKDSRGIFAPNAVVVDIQDETGKVSITDRTRALVRRLRFLHIFPIARLVVFQNDSLAAEHPEWAIHAEGGALWRDHGGRHWLDASHKEAWEHVAGVAREAAEAGFGEINFDYFRFPSEGITTAVYPFWRPNASTTKTDVINDAARYLKSGVKGKYPDVRVSADIFGYTFMRERDLGIGQSAPALAAIFDDICPMIYPSHFDAGNFNFDNPAAHPYEVMLGTLETGKGIFAKAGQPFTNIRPWIQDFNLGATYTPQMVQDQMKAIGDAGLSAGWLIWNPSNKYRAEIFEES